jgi:hypothetical protein
MNDLSLYETQINASRVFVGKSDHQFTLQVEEKHDKMKMKETFHCV